ncbi:hypothetical protein CBR_g37036 [Chara braunii]|uniref:Reverse transcriptase domain-containing protein n=1 Tax=Chara braunii TaxID=69332 RepID=A0A388LM61_CHABU|nr:hypothetical protein CBR_g37036 [Chara braunii]|eukprot:GBG83323.1 hypothetical protein CBR_g37036 [Chara braunii]
MIKDVYPLPQIDELLDAIESDRFFSKFDVRHGFHHLLVREKDRPKMAFVLFEGTWQWVRCPMGICNTPATFQRAMNIAFHNFVRKTRLAQSIINYRVIVYMDDILVYSGSYEGHVRHIEWTLHALRDAGFKVALEKCQFFLTTISFLGHVVTDQGLRPEPQKVAAVRDTPVPTTITQVRAFLGLTSYSRRFIKGFAAIAVEVTLTRTDEHQACIEFLELLIIQAWRTDVEDDLLYFLFGSVRPGHGQLIVQELVVPLARLVDDLFLDIVLQSDESPTAHVLTRTLAPYLQWTAYLEEPRSESAQPSRQEYLKPSGIINLTFYPKQDTSEEEEKEKDEEEEAGSEWEALPEEAAHTGTKAEDPEAARKREEIAAGKSELEFVSEANLRINDNPTRDPEPPKPEDGDPATAAPSASRRRQSRSPSPSASARPRFRPCTDAGDRPSSVVIIPPTP